MPAEAAPSWLYTPELDAPGRLATLDESERRYLTRVCRARAGQIVTATDGRGRVATLRIEGAGREMEARIESVERRERPREAWLLCGAPESERGDWLVEKVAELGLAVLQPVECTRASWGEPWSRIERWRRLSVAALRQSRRPFLLEIRPPLPLEAALGAVPGSGSRWLADPAGPRGRSSGLAAVPGIGAVGPSPGFDDDEWSRLRESGFEPIGLSDSRLRSETAALAWAAWWAAG